MISVWRIIITQRLIVTLNNVSIGRSRYNYPKRVLNRNDFCVEDKWVQRVHNHLLFKCYSYVYLNLLFLFKTFSTFLKVVVGLPVGNLPDTINFEIRCLFSFILITLMEMIIKSTMELVLKRSCSGKRKRTRTRSLLVWWTHLGFLISLQREKFLTNDEELVYRYVSMTSSCCSFSSAPTRSIQAIWYGHYSRRIVSFESFL